MAGLGRLDSRHMRSRVLVVLLCLPTQTLAAHLPQRLDQRRSPPTRRPSLRRRACRGGTPRCQPPTQTTHARTAGSREQMSPTCMVRRCKMHVRRTCPTIANLQKFVPVRCKSTNNIPYNTTSCTHQPQRVVEVATGVLQHGSAGGAGALSQTAHSTCGGGRGGRGEGAGRERGEGRREGGGGGDGVVQHGAIALLLTLWTPACGAYFQLVTRSRSVI